MKALRNNEVLTFCGIVSDHKTVFRSFSGYYMFSSIRASRTVEWAPFVFPALMA